MSSTECEPHIWRSAAGLARPMEVLMTVSEQVDALQKRAADLKNSFETAQTENNEQVRARISKAKADAAQGQGELNAKANQKAEEAKSRWAAMKADLAAKMDKLQADIDRKEDERDAKAAERDADRAEDNAMDALDYAAWTVEQAEIAIFYAVDARGWADSLRSTST